jgi:hypothetical protein
LYPEVICKAAFVCDLSIHPDHLPSIGHTVIQGKRRD